VAVTDKGKNKTDHIKVENSSDVPVVYVLRRL